MHHAETHHHGTNWMLLAALVIFAAGCVIMVRLIIVTAMERTTAAPVPVGASLAVTASTTPTQTATPPPQPTRFTPPTRPARPPGVRRTGAMLLTETAIAASATAAGIPASPELITATPLPSSTPIEPSPTLTPVEPGSSRSDPLPPGTELRFEHWAVVITDVLYGAEAVRLIDETNPLNALPRIEHTYLIATVQLTNISAGAEARSTLTAIDLRATGDQHRLYRQASVVPPHPPGSEVLPGEQTRVEFVFEIGLDEENLLLRVQEGPRPPRFVAVAAGTTLTPAPDLDSSTPNEAGRQRAAPALPGEPVVTDEWEVTLVEVVRGADAADLVQAVNALNPEAPAGMEYVALKLRARLIDQQEPDLIRHIDSAFLEIIDAQNVTYGRPLVVPPAPIFAADLFPGGTVEGWVVLSMPTDADQAMLIFRALESSSADTLRFLAMQ
jgi:hypothetical protein